MFLIEINNRKLSILPFWGPILFYVHHMEPFFWAKIRYCAPKGREDSIFSVNLRIFNALGKIKQKEVSIMWNPLFLNNFLPFIADRVLASESKGFWFMMDLVPGFQGLFSQNANIPFTSSELNISISETFSFSGCIWWNTPLQ